MNIRPEKILFITIVLAVLLGIGLVYDASVAEAFTQFGNKWYFARQQLMWAGLGSVALIVSSLLPMGFWKKIGIGIFFFALISLIVVLIPGLGTKVQGASRWIVFGPLRYQPSEIIKLGIILYFSSWLIKHQRSMPFLFITAVIFGLIMLEPDLGTGLVVLSISLALFIAAGGSWKYILSFCVLGIVGISLLIIASPYKMKRITAYLNPESDPQGASYHIRQITIALGSGGWFGQGIGKSRQKYRYIPEASTDSIFAIAAEETGFIGSLGIILLYGIIVMQGFRIVGKTKHKQDQLVALGITVWIASQAMLNLSSLVALVPLTGVPLPFLSYGGSSLVSMLASSGILIGIGRRS